MKRPCRFYLHPSKSRQPGIYAITQLLTYYSNQHLLAYYIDLHAHANKRGIFTYGNAMPGAQHVEALLFSKLCAVNSAAFDFSACNFTERNMCTKDKDGTTKDGAGRVALWTRTNQRLTHLYTIEANYNGARHVPEMAAAAAEGARCASPVPAARQGAAFDVPAWHQVSSLLLT